MMESTDYENIEEMSDGQILENGITDNNGTFNGEDLFERAIDIDMSNVIDCILDTKKFQNGINDVSELCGAITALTNVGIPPMSALEYLSAKESTELMAKTNKEISKMNAESNVQTAKIEQINVQKQTL